MNFSAESRFIILQSWHIKLIGGIEDDNNK